jgi:hypothetical protein
MEAWAKAHVIPSLGQIDDIVAAVYGDLMPLVDPVIGAWADDLRRHLDTAATAGGMSNLERSYAALPHPIHNV